MRGLYLSHLKMKKMYKIKSMIKTDIIQLKIVIPVEISKQIINRYTHTDAKMMK